MSLITLIFEQVKDALFFRRRTSANQKLLMQLEERISTFYEERAKFLQIGKFPLELMRNMDGTHAFF